MAQPHQPGKTMSSRLLTMKFMQRAAASTASTPPTTPPEPPSKKQRLSNGSHNFFSSSTPRSDARAVEEALASEEKKRNEALEREAAHRGETKWYLSFKEEPQIRNEQPPLRIVSAGYAALDAPDSSARRSMEEDGEISSIPQVQGRRSFGKFNRKIEKQQDPDVSSSSSESVDFDSAGEDGEEDESDDPTGAKAMIAQTRREAGEKARAERKSKRKAEKAESERLAEERRKKHVKLNKLTSISGGGSSGGVQSRSPNSRDVTCFQCGEKGHLRKDCPQLSQQRSRMR